MKHQPVLNNSEILKRLKEKNISFNKLNNKHLYIKIFLNGNNNIDGLDNYLKDNTIDYIENNELFSNIKKYLSFYLYETYNPQDIALGVTKQTNKTLIIGFDGIAFAKHFDINLSLLSNINNLLIDFAQNIFIDNFNNENDNDFLFNIENYEGNNIENIFLQQKSYELGLISYKDIVPNFKIGETVMCDVFLNGNISIGKIISIHYNKNLNDWQYLITGQNEFINEKCRESGQIIISKIKEDENKSYFY